MKKSFPFDIEQYPTFNQYLSSIAGDGDTLGKSYNKISNFALNHGDVDLCDIKQLHNKAVLLDDEIENFDLEMPEELKEIFHLYSIPLQKLIGTRCICNTVFEACNNCVNSNICSVCKFDKRSNLGSLINLTDTVTAGDIILYKENGDMTFNFLTIPQQSESVYQLRALSSEPFYSRGVANYCFYTWAKRPQNNPIEGIVNYRDERNMLASSLSSVNDYGDNGILEETFNYILTKELL